MIVFWVIVNMQVKIENPTVKHSLILDSLKKRFHVCMCVFFQDWMRVCCGWTASEIRKHEEEQKCSHSVSQQCKSLHFLIKF